MASENRRDVGGGSNPDYDPWEDAMGEAAFTYGQKYTGDYRPAGRHGFEEGARWERARVAEQEGKNGSATA